LLILKNIIVSLSMNILKIFIIFMAIVLFPVWASASNESSEFFFPDLLADELLDDDEFDEEGPTISDPLEPMNRVFFEFNDVMYEWVFKPVTDGYMWLLPRDLRVCFGNFFFNLSTPIRLLNSLLQGKFQAAGIILSRFAINTTIGIYGLADVAAAEFDIQPKRADFGQTLGKWGAGSGIYFCWPLFGPSSVRASIGLVADAYTHPMPYFHESRLLDFAYYSSNKINTLSLKPNLYDDLKRYSLDPYVASRQAFYEYRKAMIERD